MSKLTAQEIREKLFNRKRRMQKIEISLPDLQELDGQLAIQELTAKDVEFAQNASKGPDGEVQTMLMTATLLARSLVTYETKERIFTDDDRGFIADNFGLLILQPIGLEMQKISGLTADAIEDAKKNLQKTQEKGSVIS